MPEPALDQLLTVLITGTKSGQISWQEATGDGNSFVTRRPSGTVSIQRRPGVMGSTYALVLHDAFGEQVSEFTSPTPGESLTGTASTAARRLEDLFGVVSVRHTGDHHAIQQLIQDFKKPT